MAALHARRHQRSHRVLSALASSLMLALVVLQASPAPAGGIMDNREVMRRLGTSSKCGWGESWVGNGTIEGSWDETVIHILMQSTTWRGSYSNGVCIDNDAPSPVGEIGINNFERVVWDWDEPTAKQCYVYPGQPHTTGLNTVPADGWSAQV